MLNRKKTIRRVYFVAFLASLILISPLICVGDMSYNFNKLKGLNDINLQTYTGISDGGLAHITYWGLPAADPDYYAALSSKEQAKVSKINANVLHAAAFHPTDSDISGAEITGLLKRGPREQRITFRLPDNWNRKLIVGGTPGLRNEYANEAILIPWLLDAGYAYIAGDKGIPGGANDMQSGKHPTQHWGKMMIDLAALGRDCIKMLTGETPDLTYTMGLSNGGYQTRRALEIDHVRVLKGKKRLFDGGVDWSGGYWPDARVMDVNRDGKVSVTEYAAADTMVGAIDKATLAMGWFYSADTQTTPDEFLKYPRFPGAYLSMIDAGYSPESSLFWGYYNTNFDGYQYIPGFEIYRGVGYYNLVSYVYRADLRGDDAAVSAAYSCYSDPAQPNTPPPLYDWLRSDGDGGWNKESVRYALKNANTAEFSVPLLSLQGQADGLLALNSQGLEYKDAVELYGSPDLHRFYIIAHSSHVDTHVDGGWGYSSAAVDPLIPDLLTPMQAYVQRTLSYLEAWVEGGHLPPDSKLVETDPANDIIDPTVLNW
ncbi:MAG: hypothetical protein GY702_04275 [Desulfobulbaceae bacterium]|nr:hypothetical protein [Desulfobulbaceae bacterium]